MGHRQPPGDVSFKWLNDRSLETLKDTLQDNFQSILQSDAYRVYPIYSNSRSVTIIQTRCMAHICRSFYSAHEAKERNVEYILRLIRHLYELEDGRVKLNIGCRRAIRTQYHSPAQTRRQELPHHRKPAWWQTRRRRLHLD